MNTRSIDFIKPGEERRFDGESVIITGEVGQGAKIKMKNGSLTIKGSLAADVQIEIVNDEWQAATGMVTDSVQGSVMMNDEGTFIQPMRKLIIEGNVMEKVRIETEGSVSMDIRGTIAGGSRLTASNGSIKTVDLAPGSNEAISLETMNGSIKSGRIGSGVRLSSMNGSIKCGRVDAGAVIDVMNGSITCDYVAKGAKVKTVNGKIVCTDAEEGAAVNIKSVNGAVIIAGHQVNARVRNYPGTVFHGSVSIGKRRHYVQIDQQTAREENCCVCTIV